MLLHRIVRALYRLATHPVPALMGLLVGVAAAGAVAHQLWFLDWYIEDAAISFAYARNWAEGEGLVPYPGAERVEGYSNPTWVLLLAIGEWFGVDGFRSSKVMQAVLGAFTVPLVYLLGREASRRGDTGVPVVAAGFLALSTTHAIWSASGLENALFSFLLAAALLRSAVEIRAGGFPWSAALWMLLALTRPEAILYAAVAGAMTAVFTLHRGVGHTFRWLTVFFVPFIAYHAVRIVYFAWEFPQTYYAKMGTKQPHPLAWNRRGWTYVRQWAATLWTGYYLPLYLLALSGSRGWRFGAVVVLAAALGARLLLPELLPTEPIVVGPIEVRPLLLPAHFPEGWEAGRSWVLAGFALFGPLLGLGAGRGWQARVLCWGQVVAIGFFAIYTMGDWMKAWRWMSLLQVPLAVLFASGVGVLANLTERAVGTLEGVAGRTLPGRAWWALLQLGAVGAAALWGAHYAWGRVSLVTTVLLAMGTALILGLASEWSQRSWRTAAWSVATLALLVTLLPNMAHLKAQRGRPETGPFSIKKRVEYVRGIKKTLDIQHRIVDLDVDMGGHLWWGRDDFAMHDIAGLVDIPLAQHRFDRQFLLGYLFEEIRPDFVHLHGGWASNSRIKTLPPWDDTYVEIPGFPSGPVNLHIGNHVRRDLFFKEHYPPRPDRRVRLEKSWILEDLRFPSEPASGRLGWLQLALRSERIPRGPRLPVVWVSASRDGVVVRVWALPLVWDWVSATSWGAGEVFVGGFPVSMEGLEPGRYDLGFVLVDAEHRPLGPRDPEPPPGARFPDPPVLLPGEILYEDALEVVDVPTLSALARADRLEAVEAARKGRCAEAEEAWNRSRWHRVHDRRYLDEHLPTVAGNLAICWAMAARRAGDPHQAVPLLRKAAAWRHDDPTLIEVRGPIARSLSEEGDAAWSDSDWEAAFRAYRDAVWADPTRAWDRRWAEKARRRMLHPEEG